MASIQNATDGLKPRHKSLLHFFFPDKITSRSKQSVVFTDGFFFVSGAAFALLVVWILSSFKNPYLVSHFNISTKSDCVAGGSSGDMFHDPEDLTFYDDPDIGYTVENKIKNWDEKRREWLKLHPYFAGKDDRILVVTGSQPTPCRNPVGDHLLLRFFKNKVDYCRIHNYDIFYNNVLLQPQMHTYWAKIPVIRAAMVAHPEVEWIYWVDSDAAFTDMDFKLPLNKYKNHNLVVHGWSQMIYKAKSWTSLNAGVFLIRNCQWSLDFMDIWADMGPQSPNYEKWGKILRSTLSDKILPESDDQSGLIYLLLTEKDTWGKKIYIESEYYFEGYWLEIVEKLDNITERVHRRHAEKVTERYGAPEEQDKEELFSKRPFVTHFTGCQPCSGDHNKLYSGKNCWVAMEKALNFADNQVIRNFGFVHRDLQDSASVVPLPFDFPV